MWELLFLLLPVAAFTGWVLGRRRISGIHEVFRRRDTNTEFFVQQWLDSNQESVETHLTLGSLFRRRGEVDKAIGIHQNLVTKPSLTQEQRALSLLELSRDYMRAGVLDRAENVLLELVKDGHELEAGSRHLIEIYQQSKDWIRAIEVAEKLQQQSKIDMRHHIAHFYCELAEQRWLKGEHSLALETLNQALQTNPKCVRASLLLGDIEVNSGNYKTAIKAFRQVERQDQAFLSEIVFRLARCYEGLQNPDGMVKYLTSCLQTQPNIAVVLAFSDWLNKTQGYDTAVKFVVEHLREHTSIRGINRLLQYTVARSEGITRSDLEVLQELIQKLVANRPLYRCQACGFSARTLQWQCPSCKRWDVIKPIHE